MAMLLIVCAPLSSLYTILAPFFVDSVDLGRISFLLQYHIPSGTDVIEILAETEASAEELVDDIMSESSKIKKDTLQKKKNATLEEFIWSIISKEPLMYGVAMNSVHNKISPFLSAEMQMHHWSFVIPWSISFIMIVIVPTVLTFMSFIRTREDNEGDGDPSISRTKKYKRKLNKLSMLVKDHKKILQESDMHPTDVDREGVPYWNLPLPGEPGTCARKVVGSCSVCLGSYTCGDEVMWSSNPKCPHVFHVDCILSWLVRKRKQCPCCRRIYVHKKIGYWKKKSEGWI